MVDADLATALLAAADQAAPMAVPGLSDVASAYAVQAAAIGMRRTRGERVIGYSVHNTSMSTVRPATGEVLFGTLTATMSRPENGTILRDQLIAPRVQAGFAFLLASGLAGETCDEAAVLAATECLVPVIEVTDSRYRDDAGTAARIADNAGNALYVTGGCPRAAGGMDWRTVGVVLEHNGDIAALAAGAAVMGHPARAVAALVRHLAESSQGLEAGAVVVTGELTPAIEVAAGDVVLARFQDMGSVGFRCR